jgi:hypothetical protein
VYGHLEHIKFDTIMSTEYHVDSCTVKLESFFMPRIEKYGKRLATMNFEEEKLSQSLGSNVRLSSDIGLTT